MSFPRKVVTPAKAGAGIHLVFYAIIGFLLPSVNSGLARTRDL